ncbi:MAG: sugar ABC transporter substrate-binding protein [Clostridiaceae bacterium]|nr:sugar ABC transporter substrate-binding protein [Eubacteriales bacterium]
MMKHLKKPIALMLVCMAALLTFGCAGPTETQGSGDTAAAGDSDGKIHIGMCVQDLGVAYSQAFNLGAQQACDERGWELTVIDIQGDAIKTLDTIDNFIAMGIDGFIFSGCEDKDAITPGIEKLNALGIPIMALDTSPTGGKIDYFITFDLVKASEKAAQAMIDGLKAKNNGEVPTGTVLEVWGVLIDTFAKDCDEGFKNIISQYPQLTVVEGEGKWENDSAYTVTANMLTRVGSDVVAVYCHTPDCQAAGVISAIENAGLNPADLFVSGICIGTEGIELIKQGKLYCAVEQPALDSAIMAIELFDKIFQSKTGELPKEGDVLAEEGALWSPAVVAKNDDCEGLQIIMAGPLCPLEVQPDNPGLYENRIS